MAIQQQVNEEASTVPDDELVVSSTGLPTISEAPCEPTETSSHSLTPDEETGDGWIATDVEL